MNSTMTRANRISGDELRVWRSFLVAYARVTRRLEADLIAEQSLPLASYDVLVQLVEAEGHRLRMTELAERVLLTRSGLTRLIDRLVKDDLVRRELCEYDARGFFAVLTPMGYHRLRTASHTHLRGVEEYVVGRFSAEQLHKFAHLLSLLDPTSDTRSFIDHCEGNPVDLSLTTRVEGRYTVVAAVGEIDFYTAPVLREHLATLVGAGVHHLILDLDGVEFMDSTGLGVLIGARQRLHGHDGSLSMVCTRENIIKIFRITGMTKAFAFHPGVAQAAAEKPAEAATEAAALV